MVDPTRPVDLALFQPRVSASSEGRIVVIAERNLTVELRSTEANGVGTDAFRPARQEPPADWHWPPGRRGFGAPALWLRQDGSPAFLPLRITVHPRTIAVQSSLAVVVGREEVETRQDSECSVRFGTVDQLDVEIPKGLSGRWTLDGAELARPLELGTGRAGSQLVRLRFAEEFIGKHLLSFYSRQTIPSPLKAVDPTSIEVSWIRFLDGTEAPLHVRASSEPGVRLDVVSSGWTQVGAGDAWATAKSTGLPRLQLIPSGNETARSPLILAATALALESLPRLIASRLWLRTVQGPDLELRSTAWYRLETHPATFSVRLPPGARWVSARVGGEPFGPYEALDRQNAFRFRFPPGLAAGRIG